MLPSPAAGPSLRRSVESAPRATFQTALLAPGRDPLGIQQPLRCFGVPGETGATLSGRLLLSVLSLLLLTSREGMAGNS